MTYGTPGGCGLGANSFNGVAGPPGLSGRTGVPFGCTGHLTEYTAFACALAAFLG